MNTVSEVIETGNTYTIPSSEDWLVTVTCSSPGFHRSFGSSNGPFNEWSGVEIDGVVVGGVAVMYHRGDNRSSDTIRPTIPFRVVLEGGTEIKAVRAPCSLTGFDLSSVGDGFDVFTETTSGDTVNAPYSFSESIKTYISGMIPVATGDNQAFKSVRCEYLGSSALESRISYEGTTSEGGSISGATSLPYVGFGNGNSQMDLNTSGSDLSGTEDDRPDFDFGGIFSGIRIPSSPSVYTNTGSSASFSDDHLVSVSTRPVSTSASDSFDDDEAKSSVYLNGTEILTNQSEADTTSDNGAAYANCSSPSPLVVQSGDELTFDSESSIVTGIKID